MDTATTWEHKIAKHDHISETDLVRDLLAGENSAYETLLDLYEAALYRFFYYAHRNHDLAQDQCGETLEVFVTAIHNMRSHKTHGLKCFLFGIARNIMRRGWRRRCFIQADGIILDNVVDHKPSVFRDVAIREELNQAFKAIEQLEDPQRQIFLLRFVEMFTLDEIAEVMNMRINTIKSHIHRGRKTLCKVLNISQFNESEL